MSTQYEQALSGAITPEMERVAGRERVERSFIRDELAAGRLVIPASKRHLAGDPETGVKLDPIAIGRAVTTKINANIGASPVCSAMDVELAKLQVAVRCGADTVMDLSTGGDLDEIRAHLIRHAGVPIVPVGLAGIDRFLPPDTWTFHRSTITLVVGEPIRPEGRTRSRLAAHLTAQLRACARQAKQASAAS